MSTCSQHNHSQKRQMQGCADTLSIDLQFVVNETFWLVWLDQHDSFQLPLLLQASQLQVLFTFYLFSPTVIFTICEPRPHSFIQLAIFELQLSITFQTNAAFWDPVIQFHSFELSNDWFVCSILNQHGLCPEHFTCSWINIIISQRDSPNIESQSDHDLTARTTSLTTNSSTDNQ